MREILIFGSVALDTLTTPYGKGKDILGGSAVYASLGARFFSRPVIVSCVGKDFPPELKQELLKRGISLKGLEIREGDTFRWEAEYGEDPQDLRVISTCENVLKDYIPSLSPSLQNEGWILLANNSPRMQSEFLEQITEKEFVVWDTMKYWIQKFPEDVREIIRKIDIAMVNQEEARALTGEENLYRAGEKILGMGVKGVVIKKGEHGSFFLSGENFFMIPAYPVREWVDPTGAGDTFAGAFISYLSREGLSPQNIKEALVYATLLSSFTVEGLGTERLMNLSLKAVEERKEKYLDMLPEVRG